MELKMLDEYVSRIIDAADIVEYYFGFEDASAGGYKSWDELLNWIDVVHTRGKILNIKFFS